jgi:mannose-1-phosphate guanylyltransferase
MTHFVAANFNRLSGLDLGLSQLICNQDHRFLAAHQCHTASIDTDIMLEPIGRHTAPAVILSALRLADAGTDDPMLILAADHSILDESRSLSALLEAHNLVASGNIVILAIKPTFVCTGYGPLVMARLLGLVLKFISLKKNLV